MLKSTFEVMLDKDGLIAVLKTAELMNPVVKNQDVSVWVTIDDKTKLLTGESVIRVESIS